MADMETNTDTTPGKVAADGSGAMFGIIFETDPNDDSNDNHIITKVP